MKWLAALLAFIYLVPVSASARAGDVWVCSYRDSDGKIETNEYRPKGNVITMKIQGSEWTGTSFAQRVDNDYAVIGDNNTAMLDPSTKTVFVGLYTLIIDKHTKKFRSVYSALEGNQEFMAPGNAIADGGCVLHLEPHLSHDH